MLAVALLIATLTACGRQGIGEEAAAELQPQVDAVREAVEAGDRQTAAQGLVLVQTTAVQLKEDGKLDEAAFQRIVDSANDVADLLSTVQAPLQVPIDQLNGSVQQGPQGDQGGQQGKKGEKGKDGERGQKGDDD